MSGMRPSLFGLILAPIFILLIGWCIDRIRRMPDSRFKRLLLYDPRQACARWCRKSRGR